MKSLRSWASIGSVGVAAVAVSVGIALGDGGAGPGVLKVSVLEQPPSLGAAVPERIGGVPFAEIHKNIDLGERRLARTDDGRALFVTKGVAADEVCLLSLAPSGEAASTCGDASVVADYGAIPLLLFEPDGSIAVSAIVPDGVAGARADDGSSGTVVNNVLTMTVGPSSKSIALDGGDPEVALNIGLWRDPR